MTVGKDDKLNIQVVSKFEQYIKSHLKNKEFRLLFLAFFKEDYSQQTFTAHERTIIHRYFEKCLLIMFENYTIKCISWEQYCKSMKIIRAVNWEVDPNRSRRISRKMLSDFFLFIIKNSTYDTSDITELKKNKEFLIWEERKTSSKMNELLPNYLFDRMGTNFPLESSLNQLHLLPGDSKKLPLILNLNIAKLEIKSLLVGYYQNEVTSKKTNALRQFIYFFRISLMTMEKEPQSINDFTFKVFKKQYRFYQKVNIVNLSNEVKFTFYLIRFYLYLCKIITEQDIKHNIFEGTQYNQTLLSSNHFAYFYEQGYKLLVHNAFENVPTENRWQLMTFDGYAKMGKMKPFGLDFTEIKDKALREDLKYYVWYQSNMSVSTLAINSSLLIDFVNFISSYKQLNKISDDDFIDSHLLEQWTFYISTKKTNTMNNFVKQSKAKDS